MKNKLKVGDVVTLKGNPLDKQLGESLPTNTEFEIVETSKTVRCGSGLAVKINGYHGWLDSAWCTVAKRAWQK